MSKEHLFIDLKFWIIEPEEEEGEVKIKYNYQLPEIKDDFSVDMYGIFLDTVSTEMAKRIVNDEFFDKLIGRKDHIEDIVGEKEDDSSG